ncbi:helix-turn-helix domain-containing protein [Corynebacterium mastitidis]|uniref:ArsR family transcriptional regulator n=1 Tax=Corynebacterium mastitidis TaxID=161890 RepID=A0A2N0X695_9CORY|nr:helix-turn-helix domain-containing protein [Corynebacterium mastitidis]MCH6196301.1 helix-turn-helix domain-containing protein [Corynebacterium mastitidis]PKF68242.1 ArsR family transcriptional regulator [Corynebacterium mastitidis]
MPATQAPQRAPRAVTDLFPESLALSPKQNAVLGVLREFPHGASATQLSERLGMHANTVRGHLEELIAQQAVSQRAAPAQGRGRPTLIYQARVPDTRAVAEEYIDLITHLAKVIDVDQAKEVGRLWARSKGTGTVDELMEKLRTLGFDPRLREDRTAIDLRACPFIHDQNPPHPSVCGLHEGFFQEYLDAPEGIRFLPLRSNCTCTIVLSTGDDAATSPEEFSEPA